jgi:hypothetical protein
MVQLGVMGALLISCVVLLAQTFWLLRRFERIPSLAALGWVIPILIAALGLMVMRRFLRVLSEYRRLRGD